MVMYTYRGNLYDMCYMKSTEAICTVVVHTTYTQVLEKFLYDSNTATYATFTLISSNK
jgi:hypothetical protein